METQNNQATKKQKKKKKFSLKRLMKRIALGFTIFLVLLVGAMVAIPYFFKDQIVEKVTEEINNNVNAKVSFDDINLSLFRSFPDFSLRLKNLQVMGKDEFEGLRLAGIKNFDVTLDLNSVIKGNQPIGIQSINLDEPNLYVKVLKNGKANYDITIPSTDTTTTTSTDTSSSDFQIKLKSYSIKSGNVTYDDGTMGLVAKIENLNHSGKGDFTSLIYDLKTQTSADAVTVDFDGVKYLNNVKTDVDLDINVDMENMKFTIDKNITKMNALQLNMEGFVAMPGNDIDMDLTMSSPKTNFKDLLSMIPAAYTQDFNSVKANGKMAIDGKVKGKLNDTSIPAFNFNISAENADFKYPDLPLGVDNINAKMNINSPSSDLDKLVVNVSKFHIDIENNPFDAKFLLKNPMSDPYVEAFTKGTIVLDDLAKAFPLGEQGVEELSGTIKANLDTKTRMSYVTEEKYEEVDMKGDFALTNMNYKGEGMPKVFIKDMKMAFSPQNVTVDNFDAKLGKSDIQASGTLDNILTYFSGTKTMKGNLIVRSNKFDANEWLVASEPAPADPNKPTVQIEDTTTTGGSSEVFDKFDIRMDADFKDITYDIYHIKNTIGKGHFTPDRMEFEEMSTLVGKSDFQIKGVLTNVFGYLFKNETLGGNALMHSDFIDANELMAITSPPADPEAKKKAAAKPSEPQPLPTKPTDGTELFGKFNVNADVEIDKLIFEDYKMTGIAGIGNFKHDIFEVSDFSMQIGNSDMKATGIIENAIDWLFYSEENISGAIDLESSFFDMNQFMVAAPAPATENSQTLPPKQPASSENVEPFLVPADMNFVIQAHFKELLYDKVKLKNAEGTLNLENEAVNMSGIKANAFGGQMEMNGSYNSKDKEKPAFDFALDIKQFFMNEAFNQLNTVKSVAPIAKFLEGKFNTNFTINGLLGQDMMPDFSTLNSTGLLETLDAVVKGFKPVNDIANKLKVDEIKELGIKNTKNWYSIKNGKFTIQPFDINYKDIKMNIGGEHGIMQTMNYDIKMVIPRKMLEGNVATSAVNTGIDLLGNQASKLGINLKQGENINVLVNLLGTIAQPKINIKLLGMDGSNVSDGIKDKVDDKINDVKADAQAKVDSLKKVAEDKIRSEQERLQREAQAKADSLKKVAEDKIRQQTKKVIDDAKQKAEAEAKKKLDEAKKKLDDEAKKKLEDEAKKLKDKVGDDVKDKAKKKLDDLKNKYNPFKKKKKGDN